MKQIYRVDKSGNLAQAISEITAPKLLLLMSNNEQFEQHVEELERHFPGVPSIGCIGGSYGGQTVVADNGVAVIAMEGNLSVVTNVLEQASTMPVKYIGRLEEDINKVAASENNTICIDFCSGNDACVLTTIYSVLGTVTNVYGGGLDIGSTNATVNQKGAKVTNIYGGNHGGTGDGGKVSVNGKIYADADAYALIRNNDGKIKVYKENIYKQVPACRFIASKTDRSKYLIGELNGRPARKVYQDILNIGDKEMATQTFKNPLGKMNGQDICIISIKEVVGDKLECYRQVNDSDVLTLLELQDISHVVENTINQIKKDFTHISGVFSINCVFRYLLFSQEHYFETYLKSMSVLGDHAGLIGYGEHYNQQFVNQTMTCVVFE